MIEESFVAATTGFTDAEVDVDILDDDDCVVFGVLRFALVTANIVFDVVVLVFVIVIVVWCSNRLRRRRHRRCLGLVVARSSMFLLVAASTFILCPAAACLAFMV